MPTVRPRDSMAALLKARLALPKARPDEDTTVACYVTADGRFQVFQLSAAERGWRYAIERPERVRTIEEIIDAGPHVP